MAVYDLAKVITPLTNKGNTTLSTHWILFVVQGTCPILSIKPMWNDDLIKCCIIIGCTCSVSFDKPFSDFLNVGIWYRHTYIPHTFEVLTRQTCRWCRRYRQSLLCQGLVYFFEGRGLAATHTTSDEETVSFFGEMDCLVLVWIHSETREIYQPVLFLICSRMFEVIKFRSMLLRWWEF